MCKIIECFKVISHMKLLVRYRTNRPTKPPKGLARPTEPCEAVSNSLGIVLANPNQPTLMVAGRSDGNRRINCKPPFALLRMLACSQAGSN